MPNDTTPLHTNGTLISNDLKKMLLVPALTLVGAFGVSYFTTQRAQDQLEFQTQANKEAAIANAAAIKTNAEAINQVVISMARTTESLTRLASDQRDLQQELRSTRK